MPPQTPWTPGTPGPNRFGLDQIRRKFTNDHQGGVRQGSRGMSLGWKDGDGFLKDFYDPCPMPFHLGSLDATGKGESKNLYVEKAGESYIGILNRRMNII